MTQHRGGLVSRRDVGQRSPCRSPPCTARAFFRPRQGRPHFLRMPVSVLPRLFVASLAAGVLTALSCEVGACVTEEASGSLPAAPLLIALPGLGAEEPAVPLMACPVDRVPPA